jgi:hypothetical protein
MKKRNLFKVMALFVAVGMMFGFTSCSKDKESGELKVGKSYQGGVIAYIDGTGEHGLIAAPTDQSTGIEWGAHGTTVGATGYDIGTGISNTMKIVQTIGAGHYAAKLCDDLVLGGYSDWFLPSYSELNKLYDNRHTIGGFDTSDNAFYWCSTEHSSNNTLAGARYFYEESSSTYRAKNEAGKVRAVRAF